MSNFSQAIPEKPLTEVELEMMQIIWGIQPCTVREMLPHLAKERPLAYTSVSTIVRILEQKGYVHSEKVGRGHLYSATLSKTQYQTQSVGYIIEHVFDRTPLSLVRTLVASERLSPDEISEIKKFLDAQSESKC